MDSSAKLVTIFATMGAFFGPLLVAILIVPLLDIDVVPTTIGNLTEARIIIKNVGFEPARNLKVTMNPEFGILDYRLAYYTEDARLTSSGPLNLVLDMNRLANGQTIVINTKLNSTGKELKIFEIHANHEKGSTNYHYWSQNSFLLYLDTLVSALVVAIMFASAVLLIRILQSRRDRSDSSKANSSSSDPKKPDDSASSNHTEEKSVTKGFIPETLDRLKNLEEQQKFLFDKLGITPEILQNRSVSISNSDKNLMKSLIDEKEQLEKSQIERKYLEFNKPLEILIASFYYHIDDPQRALDNIEKVISQNEKNWVAWTNKGAILSKLNRHEESISCYKKALELDPNNVIILNNIAATLTDDLGKYEEALTYLEKALEKDSSFPFSYYHKGNALFYLGKIIEANTCADKALEKIPNDPSVQVLKGICVGKLEGAEKAIQYFDKAISINKNDFFALVNKAAALANMKKYEESLSFFDLALKIRPEHLPTLQQRKLIETLLDKKKNNPKFDSE